MPLTGLFGPMGLTSNSPMSFSRSSCFASTSHSVCCRPAPQGFTNRIQAAASTSEQAEKAAAPSVANTGVAIGKQEKPQLGVGEEDLLQFPDRLKWYESKFCADSMPDWNAARFLRNRDVAPGLRVLTLEVEISRERIPLRCAYKAPGQKASVRLVGGFEYQLAAATPPFSQELNKHPLFLVRGDLFAYEIKSTREPATVKTELEVLVGEREAPELYALQEGEDDDVAIELGPFQGTGLDLRSSGMLAIYRFPTVIMFVSGRGIATARALIEAAADVPNLSVGLRKEVRIYYKAPNEASQVFKELFQPWSESAGKCKLEVVATTAKTFSAAFDDDDQLMYDPLYTGAIILTGGDEEAEADARAACKEAEIATVLSDAAEAAELIHLDSTPTAFRRWANSHTNMGPK